MKAGFISDINKPKSKVTITLMENGKEISNEKEVGNLLDNHFVEKIDGLKSNIDKSIQEDPLAPLEEKMLNNKH